MKRALLNIDYTYDFVADKGKLTCGKPGQEIEEAIVHLTREFIEAGDMVVFSVDKHIEGDTLHPETELFPPHNIEGTDGRDLYGSLRRYTITIKMIQMCIIWIKQGIALLPERTWKLNCGSVGLRKYIFAAFAQIFVSCILQSTLIIKVLKS